MYVNMLLVIWSSVIESFEKELYIELLVPDTPDTNYNCCNVLIVNFVYLYIMKTVVKYKNTFKIKLL